MANSAVDKLLQSVIDLLRFTAMGTEKSLWFGLQMLAWAKLSRQNKLPQSLDVTSIQIQIAEDLEHAFTELSQLDDLGIYREIFVDRIDLRNFPVILSVLTTIQEAATNGFLDEGQLSIYPLMSTLSLRGGPGYGLPEEIISLMLSLAGECSDKNIYCPYDDVFELSSRLNNTGSQVFVEKSHHFASMMAIAVINDLDIEVRLGDPLRSPSYVMAGKLKQFDISLSFPPMGVKVATDVFQKDLFNRFTEPTNSGNVLTIQHILAQTREKAVIVGAQSILFSAGAERRLREDLLKSGVIKTVIVLPSALLPYTSIPLSILVLDKTKKHDTVRFVSGDDEQFYERAFRGRSVLNNWESLLEHILKPQDEAIAIDTPVEKILKNNADLMPAQYLLPPDVKKMNQILAQSQVTLLSDCVEIVKPLMSSQLKKSDDVDLDECFSIYEFGVADFPDFGYLAQPSKQLDVPKEQLSKKDFAAFIQPLDILLAIKGSVAKLAIAPESLPPAGDGGWMVNQSCVILRSPKGIDPKVLFMYLRSDVGQCYLQKLVSGSTIPMISLTMLRTLQIIIPTIEESRGIIEAFEEQVQRQAEIQRLRSLQEEADKRYWSISI